VPFPLKRLQKFPIIGDLVVLDRCDALNAAQICMVLEKVHGARATLVLVRRPSEVGWPRQALIDVIADRIGAVSLSPTAPVTDFVAAIRRGDLREAMSHLDTAGRFVWKDELSDTVEGAVSAAAETFKAGKTCFILAADKEIVTRAALLLAERNLPIGVGHVLPAISPDRVIAVHAPVAGVHLPIMPQLARAKSVLIFASRAQSRDIDTARRQLELSGGPTSTVGFLVKSYLPAPKASYGENALSDPLFSFGGLISPHLPIDRVGFAGAALEGSYPDTVSDEISADQTDDEGPDQSADDEGPVHSDDVGPEDFSYGDDFEETDSDPSFEAPEDSASDLDASN
jgi:hypothetical protein